MITFSVCPTEGRFKTITDLDLSIATKTSVQNHDELVEYIQFSPHDKVHLDIFEHLILISSRNLLLICFLIN